MADNQKNPFARYVQHETPSGGGENPFAQYQQQADPAPRPRRTLTQAATDTGRSLASGVGTVISGLGTVGGLVTGRPENAVSQFGDSVREYWQEGQSDQLKYDRQQRQDAIDRADGVLGKAGTAIKETVTNPALFVDTVAETAASMIPAGAAGRVGAMVSGARALSRGATPAQAAQRATRVGTAAGVGTGAVQAGGDVSGGVYADSMALDDSAWQRNPDYVARVEAGEDPEAVKHELALAAARAAFAGTVPLSVASQFAVPGGATIERAIAGAAGRTGAASPVAARTLNAVRGGLGEAAQEAIEEGGGEFVGNLAERAYVDPETDLGDGVGEGIGLGAVAGFGLGGVTGAAQRPRRLTETQPPPNAPEPTPAPEPLALPPPGAVTVDPAGNAATAAQAHTQSLQDADFTVGRATRGLTPDVNRARAAHPGATPNLPDGSPVPNPAAGPLSRAANVGVNNGAVQNAAAEQALAAAAEQQQAMERGVRGQRQPVTIDGQASRLPSNVDPETGEVAPRNRDEIKAFIHGQLERGNRPPAPNVAAAAWGMKPREAGDLIREVRAERRAALNAEATNAESTQRPESGRGSDAARDAVDAGRDSSPDAAGESVAAVSVEADAGGAEEAGGAPASELTDFDVDETVRGLEVDRADRDHLRDALAKGVSPVDGKPIASEGFRREWQDELDNLEVSVAEAEDFVRAAGRDPSAPQPQNEIAAAGAEAATSPTSTAPEPTEAQKEAGNYKKGHVRLNGHDISIENPAGSRRRPEWKPLQDAYGYIRGTVGRDKDHVDVFMTDRAGDASLPVFVVDQVDQNGRFDEHKVVMGAATEEEARATYLRNYEDGWAGLGGIRQMTQDEFKTWVRDPKKTARRASPTSRKPTAPSPMESRDTGRPEHSADGPQAGQPAAQDIGPAESRTEEGAAPGEGDQGRSSEQAIAGPAADQSADAPAKKVAKKAAKKAAARRADEPYMAQGETALDRLKKNKEFRAALKKIGDPHVQSEVAFRAAQGWEDAKAGRPADDSNLADTSNMAPGQNPVDSYIGAYVAAKGREPHVIRARDAAQFYLEYGPDGTGGEPSSGTRTTQDANTQASAVADEEVAVERVSQRDFDAALEQAKDRLRTRLEQMKGAAFRDPAQAFLRATGVSTRGMRKAEVIDAILATMDRGNAVALRDFGVEVSASVERALLAGMEGRVDRSASGDTTPAPAQPQRAAAEPSADTKELPPGVRIQLERFEAGDYERPRRGRGVTMDDYRQAARIFLEGELKAKMPTPSGDGIDFDGLSGISPRPIDRNVRAARNFDERRRAVAALAPRNDVRYYLNGVHMEPDSGRMVVTDGHRATVVEGVDFTDAALPARQNITDSDAQRTVLGRDGEWIDGRFPPWDRVMPQQHGTSTHQFDAARIAALGKGMARVYRYADTRRDHPVAHVQLGGESVPLNPGYLAEAADLFRRFGYSTFEMSALPATGNGIATVYMTSPDGQVRQVIAQSRGTSIFNDIAPDGESAAVREAVPSRADESAAAEPVAAINEAIWSDLSIVARPGATSVEDAGFPSRKAVRDAITEWGRDPDVFEISEIDDGFVAQLRDAATAGEPEAAVTARAAESAAEQAPDSEATGDAGEELWYNRRNRSGAGLQWSDVEGLNDTLKVKEVVKSKVWPRPNYQQLVEDGLRPEFAHLVKQVYDTLAAKPRVRGVPTDQQMQDYIAAVGRVRDAVFDFVRDNARVGGALERVIGEARERAAGSVSLSNLGQHDVTMLDAVFPMPEGSNSRWRTGGSTNENNAIANLIGGNKVVRALQIGTSEFTKAVKAVADGWPAPKEAWQRMYRIRSFGSGYVVSRAGRTVARELESKEAAEAFAKEHYEKSRTTDTDTAPEARAAEEAQRIGPEHRRPDEDITSERFMETFGFRGVNFGNWMKGDTKAKVRERQIHLNHAYDAMLDLAQLTGLPARAMSLEGKLGIAFGAQGSGGRGAAHFVPGVNEINLTRRTGAGSLAHEWAHALDHYFAAQAGESVARSIDPFLTQFTQRDRQDLQVRPEIAQAFRKIVNAMQSRPLTEQELKERAERARKATEEHFDRTLAPLRKLLEDTKHHVEGADAEQALVEFDALAERLREGDQGEGSVATGRKVKGLRPRTRVDEEVSQTAGQMLGVMRDTLGTSFDEIVLRYLTDADARASVIAYQAERASHAESHIPQTGEVRSDYLREAIALESNSAKRGSGKRYWSTPWELFARAFQSYVIDRLGREERRNDYLSWPQMSEDAVKSAKEMGLLQGDQYPRGAERARINEAFDALLGEIRTEETSDGQVRLFSRPDPLSNPTRAATPAQVQQVVDRIRGGWGDNAPRVEVVADADGLPARAKRDPGHVTAEGFYDDQTGVVYLVAGNIRGGRDRVNRRDLTAAQRAEQVLAHEVVGHYGIEAITGPELWGALGQTLDRMRASGRHADLFAEIDRRYRGANRAIANREAIAVMAEKGVRNSVVDRAIAAVQRFLRSLGLTMRFSEAELRQQLAAAARYVREGARPQATPAAQPDGSVPFSRTDIDPNQEVPVVAVAGGVFGDTQRDTGNARRRAQAYLRRARDAGRVIRNDDTGWQVGLSGRSIGELTAFNAGKLNLIAALPRITRVAVLARSEPARQQGEQRGRPSIRAFHTLYAPVRVNDELRIARLVVREDVNGKFAYDLQQSDVLEKLNPASAGTPAIGSGAGRNTGSSSSMTVAQLRAAVNAQGRTGWAWSRADPVGSPLFQRWFRDSKVKGADDMPTVVYHGTANEFWSFDVGRLAESTGHMTAPLGFFFVESRRSAERYAENAADGVPADERVIDAYLSIQNPKRMTIDEFQAVEDYDQARALRAELREQGHDGIHLADQGQWIAFDPSQIKSASENRGTFDPTNSDLRFSQPDTVINAVDSVLGGTPRGVAERLKSMFRSFNPRDLRENTRPAWLGALTLRHLAELGKDINLTQLDNYAGRVQRMATDRNIMQEDASDTADKWEKFIGKDRAGADATSNLMHDTTIAGVDPSIDYQPLFTGTTKRGGNEPVTAESIARRKALIEKDLKQATSATARQRLQEESDALDAMLEQERRRREAYPGLVQRFQALPEAGQQLYVEVRDAYTRQSDKMLEALVARIGALELDGHQKQALISQVRQQFESARLNGPYFPLQRFGDFWINAEDASGEPAFMMYERVQDWREAQRELKAQGYTIKNAGRKLDEARSLAGASGGFMADLQGVLEQAGVDSDTRDEVYQLYLRTLPELSVRKHQIHRKAVAGYSKDALRAFSANMFHGSFQIARLMHTHELEADLLAMKKAVDNMTADDPERALKAAALYTEANKRHEWVMNPRDSTVANTLTSLGFAWFLGTTPAAALVNLSQTAIVTYPVLAARFGAGKAFTALSQGMGRAMRNVDGNMTRGLNEEERAAFKIWYQSGAIDRSQAHNLAGLSETDTQAYSSLQRKGMHIISWMFHTAEVVNRESSALAAFRLAREAGQSFNEATKYAEDVVIETHFDYSNANRSRWIQSNTAKVLLLFRQHSLNMTWFLWRNLYLSMRGQDPAVRREAQKKMAGVLGMTGIFAGALGLPAMSVIFGIANAAAAAFGDDDDDPFDAEVEFRNFLVDMLGVDAARVIARGPVDYLTGAAISGRVSLNELWLREPQRDLEGKAMANYLLEQSAGPIFGGMLVSTLRGLQQIGEGHTWRGVETMMPKALKDGMKAIRFSTEGVNTLRGDPVIEDLSVGEALLQLAGFSPARLNERYDGISAARNFEERLMGRRSTLLNAYAMAWRAGDTEGVQKVMEKIRAFNAAQPALAISTSTIRQSLQTRMRYSSRAEGGVVLNARVAPQARQQARFAE